MTTKDFVSDFGAPTDGVSSCAAAIAAWRTWIVAHPGDTLTIPAHTYNANFTPIIASSAIWPSGPGDFSDALLIPSCTIDAAIGTTFANWSAWGTYGQYPFGINNTPNSLGVNQTGRCGAFIETCFAGATTITLTDPAEASNFVVGRWVIIGGICLSSLGGPPNYQRMEYHEIMNVSGAVITLDSPLIFSYSSTWTNSFFFENGPTQGGAACVHHLGSNWNISQTIKNINAVVADSGGGGNFSAQPIRTIRCENCSWGTQAPGASTSQSVTLINCTQTTDLIEFDKQVEEIIVEGGHYRTFRLQSSTPERLTISDGCVLDVGFSDGAGKNTTISDSTIGTLFNVGPGYGRSEVLTITNTTIGGGIQLASRGPQDALSDGTLTYLGSGLWLWSTDSFTRAEECYQVIVPGYQYAFGRTTDIITDPYPSPPIYFCVTDISETTGPHVYNYHIQTDMTYPVGTGGRPGGAPATTTWSGNPWNNWFPIPQTVLTVDGAHYGQGYEATEVCPATIDGDEPPPDTVLMPAGCM